MSKIIKVTLDFSSDLEKYLKKNVKNFKDYRVISKSLDARFSNKGVIPKFHYEVEIIHEDEKFNIWEEFFFNLSDKNIRPLIIGAGPAGLFAAVRLVEYGLKPIIIERGDQASARMKKIARYWRYGELDSETNVCFGEGGAGLYSDGKLITRIKSPFVNYVMKKLVDFGAPAEVAYISNPHLGSNKIRNIITSISSYLKSRGVEIHYNTLVSDLIYKGDSVIGVKCKNGKIFHSEFTLLCSGHSADDLYKHLLENQVALSPKDFAIGVRIEHPREYINQLQYGKYASAPELGTARYRLSYFDQESDRGSYSFCMCPGGYVLSSGTNPQGIVVNGMSNFAQNAPWSNSAIVVTVNTQNDLASSDVLSGLNFIRKIEEQAFSQSKYYATGREVPATYLKDFLNGKTSDKKLPSNSCPSQIFNSNLKEILPTFTIDSLKNAFYQFDKFLPGYISDHAILMAPETRTSAPLRITRDSTTLESLSHKGLYPCGEGAGYAGGITSAAVDGVKVAECLVKKILS